MRKVTLRARNFAVPPLPQYQRQRVGALPSGATKDKAGGSGCSPRGELDGTCCAPLGAAPVGVVAVAVVFAVATAAVSGGDGVVAVAAAVVVVVVGGVPCPVVPHRRRSSIKIESAAEPAFCPWAMSSARKRCVVIACPFIHSTNKTKSNQIKATTELLLLKYNFREAIESINYKSVRGLSNQNIVCRRKRGGGYYEPATTNMVQAAS
jgi:hypothetical protein